MDEPVDEISCRFTTTPAEVRRAMFAINGAIPRVVLMRRTAWIALVFALGAWFADVTSGTVAYFIGSMAVIALGVSYLLPLYMAWMSTRRGTYWTSEQRVTFSPAGIVTATPDTESEIGWPAIVRFRMTNEFFLYFTSGQSAQFVPLRSFDPSERERLTALFTAHAGQVSAASVRQGNVRATPIVAVSFAIDPKEVTRAGLVVARRSSGMRVMFGLLGLFILWNTSRDFYALWTRGFLGVSSLIPLLIDLMPLVIWFVIVRFTAKWATRRALRTSPAARGEQHVGVAEWGMQVSGPMYNGSLNWSAFMSASETPEFLLFFITSLQPVFIPKRLLSDESATQVRELARRGMGAKADSLTM